MDSLFHKAMVIADLHFGRQANSPVANQDNLDFLAWAIDEAKTWGATECIMLGDWFDNRNAIGLETMHYALRGLEMLSAGFERSWFIVGNHDLYRRTQRDVTSIEFAKHIPNIVIVNDPLMLDDVCFLPWLMPDEHKSLKLDARYVFAHAELAGFLRNSKSVMPETTHTMTASAFAMQDIVFTGHFHLRQILKNVCYVGNIMPFDFRDDGDSDRGLMLLQWGHDPIFRAWPQQPLYRSIKLSQLLNTVDSVLKPNMTLRMTVDMPLRYEEAQELRDGLISGYSLRKVELIHSRDNVDQDETVDVDLQTVDQIVLSGLENIESVGLSKVWLKEIYQSLI